MKRSQNRDTNKTGPTRAPDHYTALHSGFRWQLDAYFNIAEVCCSRWARAEKGKQRATKKVAIKTHVVGAKGTKGTFHTYVELQRAADALSHVLAGLGVQRGDRVAIVMPQRFETAVAYMAVFQMG
ncbi:AMP-binding protein, partial [Polaromonas sp.]|uniref:AMP-binding protein n=1 Tax=Polaromonas sp. TaxID=1869339 RepID=UPI0025F3AD92